MFLWLPHCNKKPKIPYMSCEALQNLWVFFACLFSATLSFVCCAAVTLLLSWFLFYFLKICLYAPGLRATFKAFTITTSFFWNT